MTPNDYDYDYYYPTTAIPLNKIPNRDRRAVNMATKASKSSPFVSPRRIGSCILSKGLYVQGEE